VFFHISGVVDGVEELKAGDRVQYNVKPAKDGRLAARDVKVIWK
jgi:cold shock CspA family protein